MKNQKLSKEKADIKLKISVSAVTFLTCNIYIANNDGVQIVPGGVHSPAHSSLTILHQTPCAAYDMNGKKQTNQRSY